MLGPCGSHDLVGSLSAGAPLLFDSCRARCARRKGTLMRLRTTRPNSSPALDFCETSAVPAGVAISRRDSTGVVGMAVLAGAIAAMPVAFLGIVTIPLQESLAQGAGLREALGSSLPTSEDWEILPFFLLAAVLVGAVAALVASLIWLSVSARVPHLPWLAHGLAAGLAGALSALFWLVSGLWTPAAATGLLAAATALIFAPRVTHQRRRHAGPSLTSTAEPSQAR